jgi:hypothetical protein
MGRPKGSKNKKTLIAEMWALKAMQAFRRAIDVATFNLDGNKTKAKKKKS